MNIQDKSLDLSYCGLPTTPYSLTSSQLSDITKLDLSLNLLTELRVSLTPLINLEHLNISGNFISDLPIHLNELKKLATLNAAYNFITCIEDLFIPNLQYLDLTGNQLMMLPADLGRMPNLKDCNVSYNYANSIANDSESRANCVVPPYIISDTQEDTLTSRLHKYEKHTLDVKTDKKDLHAVFITDDNDICVNKLHHFIEAEYGNRFDHIKMCTGVTGTNINVIRDQLSKQRVGLVILFYVDADTMNHILQMIHSRSEIPNIVIIDNIKVNKYSDHAVKQLLDKDIISEILSFQFTNEMAQTRIYPKTQIPQLEKLVLCGYLKKRALMRKSLSAFFFCLDQAGILKKLPHVLKHVKPYMIIREQSEEENCFAQLAETCEVPQKTDEGYDTASSISPNSSCDFIQTSKRINVRKFVLKNEFEKSVHAYDKVITVEYWLPFEDTKTVFHKLACTQPITDCHNPPDIIYRGDNRVTRTHTHTRGILRLTIEGFDGESLWCCESHIQQFLKDHFCFVYAWILCPKCIARGFQNSCRRFPIELKDIAAIHRKSHAYCLATKPRRIIHTSHLILEGPSRGEFKRCFHFVF